LKKLFKKYRNFNIYLIGVKYIYYSFFFNKKLIVNRNVKIHNVKNIISSHFLEIGLNSTGFVHKSELTYLNLKGKLILHGKYSIGRGCKIDIGKDSFVSIGKGGYINSYTKLIISNNLIIGDNCIISWNCQFLDEDFHEISYVGKKSNLTKGITVGKNVWIGCGVKIYKGTHIADGCVVASDSVVKGIYDKTNCLIGGNPSRVLKENISWQ
jgi:acetyltransferase-like isoleucine patch superfamily enzyme